MPKLCANLSLLFADMPFAQRFAAAAHAGFRAVECQFPYALPASEVQALLRQHSLQMVLHNLPAGDWAAGERGIACLPGREGEFQAGVAQALAYARALGVPRLNCLAGLQPADADPVEVRQTLVRNVRHAAAQLVPHGIMLLLEPINTLDVPGFFVPTLADALEILDEVGAHNLQVQYDLYHAARMGDDIAAMLQQHWPRMGHIQIADAPGRHEPGTGCMPYRMLLPLLDALGYAGWIGCEYLPAQSGAGGTESGLRWVSAHGMTL